MHRDNASFKSRFKEWLAGFKERYNAWKNGGELVYKNGSALPLFDKGKDRYKLGNLNKKQQDVVDRVYNTLSAAGFDEYSIAGILGNMFQESRFNPDGVGKASGGTLYFGLTLNMAPVKMAIESIYGDHSLDSQLRYIDDWSTGHSRIRNANSRIKYGGKEYKARDWISTNAGKYKKTGYKSAEEAADAFMRLYERPVITDKDGKIVGYQQSKQRLDYALDTYNWLRNRHNIPTPAQPVLLEQPQMTEATIPETIVRPEAPQIKTDLRDVFNPVEIPTYKYTPIETLQSNLPDIMQVWKSANSDLLPLNIK